jgi:deoxyribose-phosphate aldolase
VNPSQVQLAHAQLATSSIEIICPIAYPLGNLPGEIKRVQIAQALQDGASGVAIVMAFESLRCGDFDAAARDVQQALDLMSPRRLSVGLIVNSAYLTDEQALQAARIASSIDAACIMGSGFGVGTTLDSVGKIRAAIGGSLYIVAAGGCRTAQQAAACLQAGASAIATSAALEIMHGVGHRLS